MNLRTIPLAARYRRQHKLVELNSHKWQLVVDPRTEDYCRFGLREGTTYEDHDYDFVDPDGGPFLHLGFEIVPGEFISKIYLNNKDIIIETDEKDLSRSD